jgi:hypothetical protein
VYVLESLYEAPRGQVATAMRSLVSMRSVITVDTALLLRAIDAYETDRLDFAEGHLTSPRGTSSPAPRAPASAASPRSTR